MKSTIECYRGIEIWFDTDNESFQCDIDDEKSVKKSYPAIKKFIDEWKKDNDNFKSFRVERNPKSIYGGKSGIVIGIRKDGRFILQTDSGEKEQISNYDLSDFILSLPENKQNWIDLNELKALQEKQRLENNNKRKDIEDKFHLTTLKDIKPNYI